MLQPAAAAGSAHSTVRLIVKDQPERDGRLLAGVEIKLRPGWKTYWRTPGESGIPPSFDWSNSDNVEAAEVRWPAPQRFNDHGETIFGYRDEVIFPVAVRPKRAGEPVRLSLALFYAVCRDVCVPVRAEVTVKTDQTQADPADIVALERFEAKVPAGKADGLDIRSVSVRRTGRAVALDIAVAAADSATPVDIFVESEQAGLGFGAPTLARDEQDLHVYEVPVDGAMADGAPNRLGRVTLTLVQGEKALTRTVHLD
ncbi:protein-disulfide reductase DsbD domain-containing protein [Rhodoligotrophos defluvii]|uniref:protein-disulfide reductase DsbD domain-containing protein n=1 Tax=Rhodoligotrophos defluvii TaxID=2561934 RepID=UPI00148588A7|nr:protein-disulfide reductase DsbD domain-containing protein [Rhodoligotrophos defluvii]